jgi:hypothetical protein
MFILESRVQWAPKNLYGLYFVPKSRATIPTLGLYRIIFQNCQDFGHFSSPPHCTY